jgi:hypothetical protein
MYTYRPPSKRVQLICGGFSGEASAALAKDLNVIVTGVKSQYVSPELHMGMYIIALKFERPKRDRDQTNGESSFKFDLLPIGAAALHRRLPSDEPPQRRRSKQKTARLTVSRGPRIVRPK